MHVFRPMDPAAVDRRVNELDDETAAIIRRLGNEKREAYALGLLRDRMQAAATVPANTTKAIRGGLTGPAYRALSRLERAELSRPVLAAEIVDRLLTRGKTRRAQPGLEASHASISEPPVESLHTTAHAVSSCVEWKTCERCPVVASSPQCARRATLAAVPGSARAGFAGPPRGEPLRQTQPQ